MNKAGNAVPDFRSVFMRALAVPAVHGITIGAMARATCLTRALTCTHSVTQEGRSVTRRIRAAHKT